MMNKNQVKGRADTAKGTIKQAAGKATGNQKLKQEGAAQKAGGKVESGYGDAKSKVKGITK
jgi:uncharacterized protein YjbJ (UPF0337 family)